MRPDSLLLRQLGTLNKETSIDGVSRDEGKTWEENQVMHWPRAWRHVAPAPRAGLAQINFQPGGPLGAAHQTRRLQQFKQGQDTCG